MLGTASGFGWPKCIEGIELVDVVMDPFEVIFSVTCDKDLVRRQFLSAPPASNRKYQNAMERGDPHILPEDLESFSRGVAPCGDEQRTRLRPGILA